MFLWEGEPRLKSEKLRESSKSVGVDGEGGDGGSKSRLPCRPRIGVSGRALTRGEVGS